MKTALTPTQQAKVRPPSTGNDHSRLTNAASRFRPFDCSWDDPLSNGFSIIAIEDLAVEDLPWDERPSCDPMPFRGRRHQVPDEWGEHFEDVWSNFPEEWTPRRRSAPALG